MIIKNDMTELDTFFKLHYNGYSNRDNTYKAIINIDKNNNVWLRYDTIIYNPFLKVCDQFDNLIIELKHNIKTLGTELCFKLYRMEGDMYQFINVSIDNTKYCLRDEETIKLHNDFLMMIEDKLNKSIEELTLGQFHYL